MEEQLKSHFELVGEFHEAFDYPVRTEEYTDVFDKEPKLLSSRLAFMREEEGEFEDALNDSDLKEMGDALCDVDYFAYGSGQCLGINLDTSIANSDHPDITETPDISTRVRKECLQNRDEILSRFKLITHHINQFEQAIADRNFDGLRISLTNIIIATNKLGYFLNFDMDRMFREVHRSNMTKVCHNREDAEESIRRYKEEGRYNKPVIRIKGQYFLVYDEDLNKILKSYKWEVPNLAQYMGPEFSD